MTLEQVRRRYRISLIGIPIIMLSMLLTRYGVTLSPYLRLGAVFAVVTIGVALVWWGMRYGDMLDAHRAAVAAAKRWPLKGADARAAKKLEQTCSGDDAA